MKESWLYYDYLRRWWLVLLIGPTIGAILGFAYYHQGRVPAEYTATATVAIKERTWHLENAALLWLQHYRAPEVEVAINSGANASESSAVDSVMSAAAQVADYAKGGTELRALSIARLPESGDVFWKPVVLGAVFATLLVIGGIYVGDDALAYRRHLQTAEPTDL